MDEEQIDKEQLEENSMDTAYEEYMNGHVLHS